MEKQVSVSDHDTRLTEIEKRLAGEICGVEDWGTVCRRWPEHEGLHNENPTPQDDIRYLLSRLREVEAEKDAAGSLLRLKKAMLESAEKECDDLTVQLAEETENSDMLEEEIARLADRLAAQLIGATIEPTCLDCGSHKFVVSMKAGIQPDTFASNSTASTEETTVTDGLPHSDHGTTTAVALPSVALDTKALNAKLTDAGFNEQEKHVIRILISQCIKVAAAPPAVEWGDDDKDKNLPARVMLNFIRGADPNNWVAIAWSSENQESAEYGQYRLMSDRESLEVFATPAPSVRVEAAQIDTALEYCKSGGGRSIHAEELKLSVICGTGNTRWLNIKDFPPPENHLVSLSGPLGKRGIGFFRNGVQMERENVADWAAGYWQTLPDGPNKITDNFIDRALAGGEGEKGGEIKCLEVATLVVNPYKA